MSGSGRFPGRNYPGAFFCKLPLHQVAAKVVARSLIPLEIFTTSEVDARSCDPGG